MSKAKRTKAALEPTPTPPIEAKQTDAHQLLIQIEGIELCIDTVSKNIDEVLLGAYTVDGHIQMTDPDLVAAVNRIRDAASVLIQERICIVSILEDMRKILPEEEERNERL